MIKKNTKRRRRRACAVVVVFYSKKTRKEPCSLEVESFFFFCSFIEYLANIMLEIFEKHRDYTVVFLERIVEDFVRYHTQDLA